MTVHGIEVSACAGRHLIGKIAYHLQEVICQTPTIHFNTPVSQRFHDQHIIVSNYIYPSMWGFGGHQEGYRRSLHNSETTPQGQLIK